jgi:hypothetical protein
MTTTRTEIETVENLINETGLTDVEAGKVVGRILGQEYAVEITATIKKLSFYRKRFTDLIKKSAEEFNLVNSDYVTAEAIRQAGSLASEDRVIFSNCRSAIGAYVRSGKITPKMFVDVGCAGERTCLFRLESVPKIVEICLAHVTFQKLAPGYVSSKAITEDADLTRDEKQFQEDQTTLADLNGQLRKAKADLISVRAKYDAVQVDLRAAKEDVVRKDEMLSKLVDTTAKQQTLLDKAAAVSGFTEIVINRHRFELADDSNVYLPEDMVEFVENADEADYNRNNEQQLIADLKRGINVARMKGNKTYMFIGRVAALIRLYEEDQQGFSIGPAQ